MSGIGSFFSSTWNHVKQVGHGVEQLGAGVVHEGARLGADVAGSKALDAIMPHLSDKLDAFFSAHMGINFPRQLPVPKLARYTALDAGQTRSVVPLGGYKITDPNQTASFGLDMKQPGDATIALKASGPGTNWGKKGAESAVMSVYVDGKYQQDVVLWGGDRQTNYPLSLGNLGAGKHTITLRYAKEKSTAGARGITVSAGKATAVTYKDDTQAWAAKYSPIVIGRHGSLENNHTDTPLGLLSNITKNPDGTTDIDYTTVYSNEDSGDGGQPALENALWGRLTDLETMYRVHLDANGKLISSEYEDAGHVWKPFHGQTDGTHPIVRTLTDNNNVSDQSTGLMRFQLPVQNVDWNGPNEDVMRQNPQWFRAMSQELQREGKIDPKGVGNKPEIGQGANIQDVAADLGLSGQHTMADPRNYLYVQFEAQNTAEQPPIDVQVTLKDGTVWDADQGVAAAGIARDGWVQTSVKLPPGTKPSDVRSLKFLSNGQASEAAVGHVYMFNQNYQPQEVNAPIQR